MLQRMAAGLALRFMGLVHRTDAERRDWKEVFAHEHAGD